MKFQLQRSTSYTLNAVILGFVVFGILALLNFMGTRHYKRFDFTQQKLFSLAPQSIKVVKALKDEVTVTGFFQAKEKAQFDDLLNKYTYYSDKVKVKFVDPDKDVQIAKAYNVKKYQTMIVEKSKRESRFEGLSEEKLTNAIIKVGKEKTPIIYFTKGHGEKEIKDTDREGYSLVQNQLKESGYEVKDLLLLEVNEIPKDATGVVIPGPQKPFLPKEADLILAYLKKGGRAIILLDPESKKIGLDPVLASVGITAQEDLIIDPVATLFGQGAATPVISTYSGHDIVKEQKIASFYPMARSLTIAPTLPNKNIKVESIGKTSTNSWGEVGSVKSGKVKFDEGQDHKGPLNLAVAAWGNWDGSSKKEDEMRLVVMGDSDFANNRSFEFAGNGNLFLNSIAWMIADETAISIRPNQASQGRLMLTPWQVRTIFIVTIILIPLIVLGSGTVVWTLRRRVA
ncbi:MAG: hypothetical protein A2Z91_08645 [Deltaproteobacteria bacterium GWA2_38_16]|nr:MAG: hypothetical protein A2Z91_08645 [Deltaproteobacteria bacterium GWA2_38_16]OGQ03862.1 MAG: hypothetical protein A3D19_07210 [Deltaproteobacteria bacterium RIFCSPHIGHO2_02_FULL_38_15]OGQ33328.1 MAG: hypothetical protein A3A72_08495 [Deltaproteobacteria bacterium RIFCSPLOWO2_01_FULL_38_9]OGQ59734.1 MAG: hypothetical protein A3G92_03645 [Deltaproteobacteria bacterium RIFCSPLOWO2_12_FULL_38_8]HBQ20908.1 hypothetical protein [Deltaproteobacteria bacterium]